VSKAGRRPSGIGIPGCRLFGCLFFTLSFAANKKSADADQEDSEYCEKPEVADPEE